MTTPTPKSQVQLIPREAKTSLVHAPAANAEAVVTLLAGGEGVKNVLGQITFSYSDAPTGGLLTVEDGSGNVVVKAYVTSGGPGPVTFLPPLEGDDNTAMIVKLSAGGEGISGCLSITAWAE